ncbi:MAG: hypothetical protein HY985_03930 [Magnetospirillum sp.]|nr:hypothetical protein [Magnetospirillum sp.]
MRSRVKRAAALALILLGGCTETTLRLSSWETVRLDGHRMKGSWIRVEDDAVDLVVTEEPLWIGTATPDMPRLDRALARKAAEDVMGGRCWGRGFAPIMAAATVGDQRHAFRYKCGS